MKRLLLSILCYLLTVPNGFLFSQNYQNSFRIIGKADGLPSLLSNKVYETSDGYLWLATQNGLARYDGKQFKMFYSFYADSNTITGNVVTDLEEDKYDQLWISSFSNGLSIYNLKSGKWQQYKHPTPDANPVYRICDLHLDKNINMWVGTMGRGLLKYEYGRHTFTQYLLNKNLSSDGNNPNDNTVRRIADDPFDPDILWLACMDGLYRFSKSNGSFTHFENRKQGKLSWKDNCFHTILVDKGNMIWLGTWGAGIVVFDKITHAFTNYPYDSKNYSLDNLGTNIVFDLYRISDTSLYVASSDRWLLEWNIHSHKFYPVISGGGGNDQSDRPSVMGISATSHNCLWICGSRNIYLKTDVYGRFGNWQHLYRNMNDRNVYEPQLNDALWMPANNSYWLACSSGDGILEYDSNFHYRRSIFPIDRIGKETVYRCIRTDTSRQVWIQTRSAPYFYWYDRKSDLFQPLYGFYPEKKKEEPVSRFVIDRQNRLWTATDSILLMYDISKKEIRQFRFVPDPASHLQLPLTEARMVMDHNDRIWIGSNIGAWSFDTRTASWEHLFPGMKKNDVTLGDAAIGSIAIDRNNKVWLSPSSQGIQVYDQIRKKIDQSFHVSKDPSFHSTGANYMQTAPDGNMWACTYNGLAVWERDRNRWEWFYQRDGLVKDYADQPLVVMQNGKALLAQYDGFISFDTRHWLHNEFVPRLKMTGINIDGNEMPYNEADLYPKVEVRSNQKRLMFSFAAIEPVFPDRVQYWYKMDGYDNNWHIASLSQVEYGGLGPGNYKFHIKAQNSDGLWSRELIMPVIVLAPLWKKWWFVPSLSVLLLLFFYGLYRYRLSQVIKMQRMRNRISRNLHDEIGSSVSSVNMLSVVAKKQLDKGHPVRNLLNQIGESAQQAGESIDEIVWSINPGYDVAATTFNRIRNHVSELFESTGIAYAIMLPEVSPDTKLDAELRQDLWLICKEAVNNIIKYSGCRNASLQITWENKSLAVKVTDDGKGFDRELVIKKSRNGLENMRARVTKYRKGVFTIDTAPGNGTRIYCSIPVKNNPKM